MAPNDSQASSDPIKEWVQDLTRTARSNTERITVLETDAKHVDRDRSSCAAAHEKREAECKAELRHADEELSRRMAATEQVVNDLAGTVDRFIAGHEKQSVVDAEARAESAKLAEGNRGRGVQLIGYLLALVGTIIMAWVTYQAHQTTVDMPAAMAKAVAEGIKQAAGHP